MAGAGYPHGGGGSGYHSYGAPPPNPYSSSPYSAPSAPPAPSGGGENKPPKGSQQSGYGSAPPHGGYGSSPPPQGGYGSAPTPSGYPSAAPSGYGSAPPSGYGSAPPSGYGSGPPSGYGSGPPSGYGSGPPSGYGSAPPSGYGSGPPSGYGSAAPAAQPYGSPFAALVPSAFPPGTDPNVVACFQAADADGSGFIDDKELQRALSSYNQSFSLRTVHLMMYLFTSSNVRKIGPKEFISVFYSLQSWRAIFERFDRDRSGRIDMTELRDALLSLGFAVSPTVLELLVSKFDKSGGKNKSIEYDHFIECCLTVKGLTEKFKEKDTMYTGSATFTYESFMLTVLPFLIA
ncbi:putative calcium-binding protein CML49 [Iris pallida]|uniref:Calcium-binding protein CML49 n=1 Tax=Iris pallida TaxID=29817 RepID=A0AAX6HTM4_IRIPA|nr:putative calcium-binding protein CML49 [Iris pallida]